MTFVLAIILTSMLILDRTIWRTIKDPLPWHASPFFWLTIPWLISITLLLLPIIIHREHLEAHHVLFIAGCFLAFMVGTYFHHFSSRRRKKLEALTSNYKPVTDRTFYTIASLGLIGHAAAAYNSIQLSGISLIERLTAKGLAGTRAAVFEAQAIGAGGKLAALEPLTAFSFVLCACYLIDLSKRNPRANSPMALWTAAGSILLIVFNALLISAGRMNILLLVMTLTAILLLDPNKYLASRFIKLSKLTRASILSAAIATTLTALFFLSTTFVEARVDGASPDFMLNQSHRASVNPEVDQLTRDVPALRYGIFTLSYLTVPIPTLVYYLDLNSNSFPGPFWGQYNFPGFSDHIMRRTGTDLYVGWAQARGEVFGMLLSQGYGGNVWSTLLRDLSVDFTKYGAIAFMFFFGWLSRAMAIKAYLESNPFLVAATAAVFVVLGYSVLHSLFYIQTVWGLFFYSSIAYLTIRLLEKFKRVGA